MINFCAAKKAFPDRTSDNDISALSAMGCQSFPEDRMTVRSETFTNVMVEPARRPRNDYFGRAAHSASCPLAVTYYTPDRDDYQHHRHLKRCKNGRIYTGGNSLCVLNGSMLLNC
jgi:hypothetical protein